MAASTGIHRFQLYAALAGTLLAWCPGALALNPELDISQYAHASWKIRDGFARGRLNAIAQTPDGYLWIGTEFGLVRFDGVRPVEWQPPAGQALPDTYIRSLLSARNGTLWIGTLGGLASWKDGRLTSYRELAGKVVDGLLEDREGTIWVGSGSISPDAGRLCAIRAGQIQCHGEDGSFGQWVGNLHEDRSGRLWVPSASGLWQWRPGPPKLVSIPDRFSGGFQSLGDGDGDALLIATRGGIKRLVDGKVEAFPIPGATPQPGSARLLRDRDGSLWIGDSSQGLLRVRQGRRAVFARSEGLSGDRVNRMFEDREGNIWVTTENGLDRFREFSVHTLAADQGLSAAPIASVLAARDGSVWISSSGGLHRWHDGRMTVYRERASAQTAPREARSRAAHEIVAAQLPDRGAGSLLQDSRGRIWLATRRGVGYLEQDRFALIDGLPEGYPDSIVEDKQGYLWIANRSQGLLRLSPDHSVRLLPWASLGRNEPATRLVADPILGGLWVGYFTGGIAYLAEGQMRAAYGAADGLGKGRVNGLRVDRDGTLWAATEGGLSRVKNGRAATLTSRNGLPCDSIHATVEDDLNGFWLYTACGFVRIARSELQAWEAAADRGEGTKRKITVRVLDSSDGVQGIAAMTSFSPHLVKSSEGRLWFVAREGVGVVDPRHLPHNALPPPVHIERIVADRKPHDVTAADAAPLGLPSLVRDLQIDYTATSLVAPENVRFRYKLEGQDRDWQDAGTRRQAFYNDLPPGNYRFRVSASNNSGVWNETGASLGFSVAPAYYQAAWFRVLVAAALAGALWAAYRWRVGVLAARLAEVQSENRERRRAEEALRESDGRFRVLTDLSSDWYWRQDEDLRFAYVGPSTFTGWSADMSIGKRRWELPDVIPLSCSWEEHQAVLASRQPFRDFEYSRRIDEDGAIRYYSIGGAPIFDQEGRFKGYQGVGRDITERKHAEERVRLSEERYALAMEAAADGHMDWDLVTGEHYLSSRMLGMVGHPPDATFADRADWVRRFPFHSEDRKRWEETIAAHFSGREAKFRNEFRVVVNGETRWLAFNFIATRDAAGQPVRWTGSIADITERKGAEESLRESRERYALAVAGSDDGIWDCDFVLRRVFVSVRARELAGMPPGPEMVSMDEFFGALPLHPDDVPRRVAAFQAHLAGETPAYIGEFRLLQLDGTYRWRRLRGLCVRDSGGKPLRMAGSISDIDARKRAEAALRLSEERYALALEASEEGHFDNDFETGEIFVSARVNEIYGLPPHARTVNRIEFLRQIPLHPDDRERVLAALSRPEGGDRSGDLYQIECRIVPRPGEVRWIHSRANVVCDANGRPRRRVGVVADITERKRAEEALRQSEERYALVVAGSNEGIFDWDLVSDRVYVSYRAQELFGIPRGELWRRRRDWRHILSFHPDDAPRLHDSIKAHIQGGTPTFDEEFRVVVPGGGVRWYRQRGIALREESGKTYRLVGSIGDVTERHNVEEELRAVERKLRQAQRLEAIGTLAGGIAHDFNNILGAVLGYGEMALRSAPGGSRLRRDLDNILAAGERGRSLVDRVLAFSRSGVGERVHVHAEKVVSEALDLIEARLPPGVQVEAKLRAGRAAILGESTQVHQVVMNLGTNAVQAMAAGGTLAVSLELIHCEAARPATVGNLAAGEYIQLTVADSGAGIPHEIIERIFDPFFTTKEAGVGTGLGLSLVHGIVMDLGGALDVMSGPGAGSTFTVFLPRTGDVPGAEEDKGERVLPHGAGERVLVVDDEEPLVRLITETLDELGYAPVGFTSSTAALDAFRADSESFAAVITDERMPGISGAMLIREVRHLRQSIPILLVSGYIGGTVMDRAFNEGASEVLKKPLSARDLAASLARVLHG